MPVQSSKPIVNISTGEVTNYTFADVYIPEFNQVNHPAIEKATFSPETDATFNLRVTKGTKHFRASCKTKYLFKNPANIEIHKDGEENVTFMIVCGPEHIQPYKP